MSVLPQYLKDGITRLKDLEEMGLVPPPERLSDRRPVALSECIQEIPCNSCFFACRPAAIRMNRINDIPRIDFNKCTGCMACLFVCPGLALFLVHIRDGKGYLSMQYEFFPPPKIGNMVMTLDREGKEVGEGRVARLVPPERNDGTALVTLEVPVEHMMNVRGFKVK